MRSLQLGLLCLSLYACSNSETGFLVERSTVVKEERPLTTSNEIVKEELKDSARGLMIGKGAEEKVVEKFSEFFKVGATDEDKIKDPTAYLQYLSQIEQEAAGLNNELGLIFKDRIDQFISLLNASLEQNKIPTLRISIDLKDPSSAKMALDRLYQTLKMRAKSLSLREQYMVFQLTEYLINQYGSENQEAIVPRDTVRDFAVELIKIGRRSPQDTFRKYQLMNKYLSDGDLLLVFKPIIAKVAINDSSNNNEIEMFRKMFIHAVIMNDVSLASSKEEVQNFFKSINYSSSLLVKKLPAKNSQGGDFFKALDNTFKANEMYLAGLASANNLSIKEVAEIQDDFVTQFYHPFLESLDNQKRQYDQFLKLHSPGFSSVQFELELINYLAAGSFDKAVNGIIRQGKMSNVDFAYLTNKLKNQQSEIASFQDEMIRDYMNHYHTAVSGSLVLSLVGKYNSETNSLHQDLYKLYESSKDSLKLALKERQDDSVLNSADYLKSDSDVITLKAGIFKGNISTAKKLYLNPLTVLVPEGDSLLVEAEAVVGGRIDGSFQYVDTMEVKNKDDAILVSRGQLPSQNGITSSNHNQPKRLPCKKGGGGSKGKNGGNETGGADDCDMYSKGTIVFSSSVNPGTAPAQETSGIAGIKGKDIEVRINKNTNNSTPIFSFGMRGFKGRRGINSPLCNSANEYQPFLGSSFRYTCTYTSETSECNSSNNSYYSVKTPYHVGAGMSGNGGTGGKGGNIKIVSANNDASNSYPALSLGGLGGMPGDPALCISFQQTGLVGNGGVLGPNGKILF